METDDVFDRRGVLVVDDYEDAARTLVRLLALLGYRVHSCASGQELLDTLIDYRPAVILLDIALAGMDGYQVARAIRAQPEYDEVWVVAVTGMAGPEYRQRALDAGFDDYLLKPVETAQLKRVIDGCLAQSHAAHVHEAC